jgi:uridine kinase
MGIIINGKAFEYKPETRVMDLVSNGDKSIISCKVDHRLRDLSYVVKDGDEIELLGFDDEDSVRVYEASLRYLVSMAINKTYPSLKANCDYYISRSIGFRKEEGFFDEDEFKTIKSKLEEIVANDYPFIRESISLDKAREYYKNNGFEDKVDVFKYRKDNTAHVYYCDDYVNYMYSYMVPSTGYLNRYNLFLYKGRIVLQYPRAEKNGEIPPFNEESTYEEMLLISEEWGRELGALTVSDINRNIENNPKEFIRKCEARHAMLIKELGERIVNKGSVKLIAIAGPSSSGKTTFSNKLRAELESRGIYPVKISMDDYYLDRSGLTPEEERTIDYEDINLIDIELFNKHLKELTDGKEVTLPRFNFVTKKREVGETIKLGSNEPIIIEGIHALNEMLTKSLPRENKFEIYIGPHIQINIDNYTPISMTHLRLIRRLVRDYLFRGSDVSRTLGMWDSVRRGEFKWIYNNQEGVDFVYNSVLEYEFCVMKKYVVPLLQKVDKQSSYYNLSRTLLKYLKYFVDVKDDDIPCDSLLREFIGGSCYKE